VKAAVILNGQAGTLRADPRLLEKIAAAFASHGIEAEMLPVCGKDLAATARAAVARGVDLVVAGGGDGTVAGVARGLVGGDVPLAVLPLGTFNHFSRDLGMPTDIEKAIAAIATAERGTVDVGEVNGHLFLNNSSIGLYPHLVRTREDLGHRSKLGKWWATLRAAFRVLRRFPLHRVTISAAGDAMATTTPVVFLGNNVFGTDLFRMGTRAQLDGGTLQLYVPRCTTRLALIRLFLRAVVGRLRQAKDFVSRRVEEVVVHVRRSLVRVATDGEILQLAPPLHYRIRAAALPVLRPARPA
jgi:diacylglycerol kinase family enzyme